MMAAALWLKARFSVAAIFSRWPAAQPTPMAKKFLKAAQISTPITSARHAGVIVIRLQHGAETFREAHVTRGDDGAGLAPDREFARDAGAADGGDGKIEAGAALHLGGDMVGECRELRLLRVHALGDHDDGDGALQRLAQAVDGPGQRPPS